MSSGKPTHTPKDSHYARLRRQHREHGAMPALAPGTPPEGQVYLYGLHTVRAAIDNPARRVSKLMVSRNALQRLEIADPDALPFPVETVDPRAIDALAGTDAVHQGALAIATPLKPKPLAALGDTRLVLVLDQVTDPHNVGAIMRSCVAFGAGALITTARHSPQETGVLAKAASGALEYLDHIEVRNLAEALEQLQAQGFRTIGLDSEGETDMESALSGDRIALVMGAEGKGLRQKTRETVTALARLDMPGAIKSLNVSNAAAIALYATQRWLKDR